MSALEAIRTIRETFERRKGIGHISQKNGTQLAGHLPNIAPKAYLHELYAGVTNKMINKLESDLNKKIPPELKSIYYEFNGFSFFHAGINLFGTVVGQQFNLDERLPYSLVNGNLPIKTPPQTTEEILYIGTYGLDSSLVYIDTTTGNVHRTKRNRLDKLASWDSVSHWICVELPRLDAFYAEDVDSIEDKDYQLPEEDQRSV